MFAGDACKARVGPKPALFHHFCYENYCKTILKTPAADDEECNYCMDCRHPKTTGSGPDPIMVSGDLTVEKPTGPATGKRVEPPTTFAGDDLPAKRKRGGKQRE
jgi:hypothetical protein